MRRYLLTGSLTHVIEVVDNWLQVGETAGAGGLPASVSGNGLHFAYVIPIVLDHSC
jgi:hypothetical protein